MSKTNPIHRAHRPGRTIVILIGIFKLAKGCLMILAAAGALALTKPDVNDVVRQWISDLSVGPLRQSIGDWIVSHLLGMHINKLRAVAVGAGIYATLFFTEGAGLLWDKTWAEWMVVVTSAGLIPVEVYEIVRRLRDVPPRPIALPVLVGFLNIAIVIYLYFHVRNAKKLSGEPIPRQTPPEPPHPDAGSCGPDKSERHSEASASVPH